MTIYLLSFLFGVFFVFNVVDYFLCSYNFVIFAL